MKIKIETYQDAKNLVNLCNNFDHQIYITDGNNLKVSAKSLLGALYSIEFNELYLESDKPLPSHITLKYAV